MVSEGCGRHGGAGIARVGGKLVPTDESEVAGHGRVGRLPQMFLRRLPERAARQRPWVLRLGGYPCPRGKQTKNNRSLQDMSAW